MSYMRQGFNYGRWINQNKEDKKMSGSIDFHGQYNPAAKEIHHSHYKAADCPACGRCFCVQRVPMNYRSGFSGSIMGKRQPAYACCECGQTYERVR